MDERGLRRPAYVNVNSEAFCSWSGMASDLSLQAIWLRLSRFLHYLTQLNTTWRPPQGHWQPWILCQLPSPGEKGLGFQPPLYILPPKVYSGLCLNVLGVGQTSDPLVVTHLWGTMLSSLIHCGPSEEQIC